jgi:hypothetical protein
MDPIQGNVRACRAPGGISKVYVVVEGLQVDAGVAAENGKVKTGKAWNGDEKGNKEKSSFFHENLLIFISPYYNQNMEKVKGRLNISLPFIV